MNTTDMPGFLDANLYSEKRNKMLRWLNGTGNRGKYTLTDLSQNLVVCSRVMCSSKVW